MNREPLASRLLTAFVGELDEMVRALNADLLALEDQPKDAALLKSVFRAAHTLKGAARAASVPAVEQACHALEAMLVEARDGSRTLGRSDFRLLFAAADALSDAGQRLRSGRDLADSPLAELHAALAGAARGRKGRQQPAAPKPPAPPAAPGGPAAGAAVGPHHRVRVDALKLDSLLDSASNLLVTSSRVAERRADLEALHDLAARSAQEWRRAARRLRLALERSGAPATAVQTVSAVDESLRRVARDSGRLASGLEADARALSLASGEVADRARGLRMRPFAEACEALPRAVRDLADAAGKEVRLAVTGGEVEMDRAVLDGLREALLHLVRNAVDHGIEPPAARQAAGKPRGGLVTVAAALRGDRVVVTVADDGAGLNLPAIKHQLARRGLPIPTQDRDLIRALFESGLSTRAEATPISGRGVGLDIVRAATERIRGGVSVSWEAGRGTTFTLDCPPTLAVIRALLVAVGRDIVAIPVSNVERLLRLSPGAIRQAEGRDVIATDEGPVPLVALARLLPPLVERPVTDKVYAVLLNAGGLRLALAVDELLVEQEAVMRPVGRKPLPRVSGAVLLGSGKVALVLDAQAAVLAGLAEVGGPGVKVAAAAAAPARRRVLVVDDSITTRALEQSILEAAGYDVLTAVDGSEAWRALLEHGADLVVADVEMPRMDGFALCEAIRGSKRFKELPIVLVTAMETPEHRARGLEVGADAYIGKSSFDQQGLLDTIRQLLGS